MWYNHIILKNKHEWRNQAMNKKYSRKPKSEVMILRVSPEFKEKLQEYAYTVDRPMADIAREAILKAIEAKEAQN